MKCELGQMQIIITMATLQHRLRKSDDVFVRLYRDDSSLMNELYLLVKGKWYGVSLMNLRAAE